MKKMNKVEEKKVEEKNLQNEIRSLLSSNPRILLCPMTLKDSGFLYEKIAQRKKRIHPEHSLRFNHVGFAGITFT